MPQSLPLNTKSAQHYTGRTTQL